MQPSLTKMEPLQNIPLKLKPMLLPIQLTFFNLFLLNKAITMNGIYLYICKWVQSCKVLQFKNSIENVSFLHTWSQALLPDIPGVSKCNICFLFDL